jgi:hypothetical protein
MKFYCFYFISKILNIKLKIDELPKYISKGFAQQQALKEYLNFVTRLTQLRSNLGDTDEILQALSRAIADL